jgi:hypothetical protein
MSDEEKDELIDKHWDINVSYEWWDCTYDEFKLEMQSKGITVNEMNFTGFYSQGDGASFTGRVDMIQFLKVHDLDHKYMAGTFFAEQGELWADITRGSSRYAHENSVNIALTVDSYNNYEDSSTRFEIYETMQEVLDLELPDLEKEIEGICKGYMRDLYAKLRDEYEALTSKEAIWDTIVANELHVLEAA